MRLGCVYRNPCLFKDFTTYFGLFYCTVNCISKHKDTNTITGLRSLPRGGTCPPVHRRWPRGVRGGIPAFRRTAVPFFTFKNCSNLNPLSTKLYLPNLKIQSVPRSKHSVSVTKTSQLMLYREIIAVCSQIHTKHINTLCGQNVELYIKTQSVPLSKHTPSQLYKPVSQCCIGK